MTTTAAPAPRLPPLRDRRQCARYVASLIRAAHRGVMPMERAKALAYMTQVLAGLIGDAELDERLIAIEERLAAYEGSRV